MGRRGAILAAALAAAIVLVGVGSSRAQDPAPRVTGLTPSCENGLLYCRVATTGLPGERLLSTLQSGLDSAVEVRLDVLNRNGDLQVGNRIDLRLSFDPWEEVYAARLGREETRLPSLADLLSFLAELPPLAVAPLSALPPDDTIRIRAGLRLHPLAPDTRGRVAEVLAGGDAMRRQPGDAGQEVSVSLGSLIRFFYGGEGAADLVGVLESAPFRPKELCDE